VDDWLLAGLSKVENGFLDKGLPEEEWFSGDGLLEEGCLIDYWLVELSFSILLKSSFVRWNWILFASCRKVINLMRCLGIGMIFVFSDFVIGLLFCLVVVGLVLVIFL
jgi:hypothetical protein